jgi:HK97 family phage portal protein
MSSRVRVGEAYKQDVSLFGLVRERARAWVQRAFKPPMEWWREPSLRGLFDGGSSSAGVSVSAERIGQLPEARRAIGLIAMHMSSLPIHVFERLPDGSKRRIRGRIEGLLNRIANPEMSSRTLRELITRDAVQHGAGYAEITRNADGTPLRLWYLSHDRVRPARNAAGRLVYRVSRQTDEIELPASDVFSIVGPFSRDGYSAEGPAQAAHEALGNSLALQIFASSYFRSGLSPGGTLETPAGADPTALQVLRESLERRHEGAGKSHRLMLLSPGMKFTPVEADAEKTQVLQSRQFAITEASRIFGVSPVKLADLSHATFRNHEEEQRAFVVDTLGDWGSRWEAEVLLKLIPTVDAEVFAEIRYEDLLRGDTAARGQFYQVLARLGAITANEIRSRENLPPVPDGNTAFVSRDLVPLSEAARGGTTE